MLKEFFKVLFKKIIIKANILVRINILGAFDKLLHKVLTYYPYNHIIGKSQFDILQFFTLQHVRSNLEKFEIKYNQLRHESLASISEFQIK